MGKLYRFSATQRINTSQGELWDFISTPDNLKLITPPDMNFKVLTNHNTKTMYSGMIINYFVSPILGIKLNWVTEITHCEYQKYFVDEQRFGPFAFWHHKHFITQKEGYVEMTDVIDYKLPFGFLGAIANLLFVKKRLKFIFDYRRMVLEKRYPA